MKSLAEEAERNRLERLRQLKAFGLWIKGGVTLYQIAERIGIAEQNPSTAAGRARTRVWNGWKLVKSQGRWERWRKQSGPDCLSGARLSTHPPRPPEPPIVIPELSPLERILARLEEVEKDARDEGFGYIATGLVTFRQAVRYQEECQQKAKAQKVQR